MDDNAMDDFFSIKDGKSFLDKEPEIQGFLDALVSSPLTRSLGGFMSHP